MVSAMHPIRLLSVSAQVAARLRAEVERGQWLETMPGVGNLATQLGVNHNAVEAALRQLEQEGLLAGQGPGRKRLIVAPGGKSVRPMRVAILPYELSDRFSAYMVEIQHALAEAGHTVVMAGKSLVALGMDPARIRRLVLQTEADAWIVQAGSREVLEWFAAQPVPAIALFGRRDGIAIAGAGPEMHTACALAIRQLIVLGHRRVVMIRRSERRKPGPGITETILLEELAAHGLPTSDYNLPDWEETREGLQALLSSLFRVTPPTALIIGIGECFFATQQFLAKRGIRVPEQVSLLCLDSDPSFDWCTPSIAHIWWDLAPVVRRLVRWAKSVSKGRNYVKQTLTPAELIPGGTIGPAPRSERTSAAGRPAQNVVENEDGVHGSLGAVDPARSRARGTGTALRPRKRSRCFARERRQMRRLRGAVEGERLFRRRAPVLIHELAALFQQDTIHFLHRKIRRDEARTAIHRVRMFRQLRLIEGTARRHGNAVAINEGIKPVGCGTARRAEEAVEAVVQRTAFDPILSSERFKFGKEPPPLNGGLSFRRNDLTNTQFSSWRQI